MGRNFLETRLALLASRSLTQSGWLHQTVSKPWRTAVRLSMAANQTYRELAGLLSIAIWAIWMNGPRGLFWLLMSRRIVFGPFLGEVGIELLYWAPTVNFIKTRTQRFMKSEIVSRGGMYDWYLEDKISRYHEVYNYRKLEDLEAERVRRVSKYGVMKQVKLSKFEKELLLEIFGTNNLFVIHPSLLLFLYQKYWDGLHGLEKILPTLEYAQPKRSEIPFDLPMSFTAVRLYDRQTFRLPENLADVNEDLMWMASRPMVSINPGEKYDDHNPLHISNDYVSAPLLGVVADHNLHFQTQVVIRAEKLVATHGGAAYLGILTGVNTIALETGPTSLPPHHTALALHLARKNGTSFSILNPGW